MQLMLFADLPIPNDAAEHLARRSRICVPWFLAVQVLRMLGQRQPRPKPVPEQMPLAMPLRELDRDDIEEPLPVHKIVSAADAEPLRVEVAAASIFTLADAGKAAKLLRLHGRFGAAEQFTPAPYIVQRSYADGSTRLIRQREDETEAWREKEAARRARQRPPKPTAKAKTRGKKVRAWDGECSHDE